MRSIQKRSHRAGPLTRVAAAAAVGVLSVGLAGCGLDKDESSAEVEAGSIDPKALDGEKLVIGSKDFDEQLVLGQITLLALKAAGADVTDKTNIAGSTATRQALLNGNIDVYWDYTGTGWINYLKHSKPITDEVKQYEAVRDEDLAKNGLVWAQPAPLNNTYAMAVTDEFAEENSLASLSDMADFIKENEDKGTICVESEFANRPDGLQGMLKTYGMKVPSDNIKKLGTGVIYTQLDKGDVCNFGEVFTTDGRIATLGLTVLEDDKGFFPLYNAGPIVTEETDKELPEILEVLAPIAETLTTEKMTELNAKVSSDGEKPEKVAEDFLSEEGFIK